MTGSSSAAEKRPFEIKALGRHSMIYGVGMLLTKAVAFLMLPIYTRLLTPADYGVLSLIFMTFEVVTIIAGSRISIGIFHFYQKEESDEGRRDVLSTAFIVLTTTYSLAALVTILGAPQIAGFVFGGGEQYTLYLRVAAATMAFEGLALVPIALIQLKERSGLYVGVNLVRLAIQVVLNLIFLIPFEMGVLGVLLGALCTHGLIGLALASHLVWKAGLRVNLRIGRSFLRFGLPLVFMQIATFVSTFGDRYFLNVASNTTQVGLYSLAYQFGFLVASVGFSPFHQIWDPQRFSIAKRDDRDQIFARVFLYMNVFLISVALGIALFGGDVVRLMADAEFHSASVYIPILAAAYVFQSWGSFLNLGIYLKERTGFFAIANWAAAIVAVIGYVTLIPRWYAWGAVLTTLVSLMVRAALAHLFSQRLWRIEYEWGPVVRVMALATLFGGVGATLPAMPILASIGAHTGLFLVYAGLLWMLPILVDDEREAVKRLVGQQLGGRFGRQRAAN